MRPLPADDAKGACPRHFGPAIPHPRKAPGGKQTPHPLPSKGARQAALRCLASAAPPAAAPVVSATASDNDEPPEVEEQTLRRSLKVPK